MLCCKSQKEMSKSLRTESQREGAQMDEKKKCVCKQGGSGQCLTVPNAAPFILGSELKDEPV